MAMCHLMTILGVDIEKATQIIDGMEQAGCPYDNAVAESTYRAFKMEFGHQEQLSTLEELAIKTRDTLIGGTITAFTVVSITKHLWTLESSPNQIHFITSV